MLLLPKETEPNHLFPDHLDPGLRYYLPGELELVQTAASEPDFLLMRYYGDHADAAGGLLHFNLALSPPSVVLQEQAAQGGFRLREVGFDRARFRLRLRTSLEGEHDETSEWRPAVLTGRVLASPGASLTAREVQVLQPLLEDEKSVVDVDLDLRYQALVPGLPWLVTARLGDLHTQLAALLPDEPVRPDQVVAAFLSLPADTEGLIRWCALEPGAAFPGRDVLLEETALRSLDILFDHLPSGDGFEPPRYQLRPGTVGEPVERSWDLIPPRLVACRADLTWSISALYQILGGEAARQKLFPVVTQVSPFSEVDIHLVNRLPFDASYLRRATVEVRYPGPQGVVEYRSFTFNGQQDVQKFSTFYPAITTDFWLEYRLTTVLAPPGGSGWPVVQEGAYQRAEGPLVELTRQTAGMDFVRVEAESGVFEKADRIEIDIQPARAADAAASAPTAVLAHLVLNSGRPRAAVALPGVSPTDGLTACLRAYAAGRADLPPVILWDGQISDRRVRIAAYRLEVLVPNHITVCLEPQVAGRFEYVSVWLAPLGGEGRVFSLAAGETITWNFFRPSVFDPLCYRYRVEYVEYDSDHHTLPIAVTDWVTSQESSLTIQIPLPEDQP